MSPRATLVWLASGVLAGVLAIALHPSVRVIYNGSDSAPRGFYRVALAVDLKRGDYVVAMLPREVARFAAARGYLPESVPVLKRIEAVAGQRVCVQDATVSVDGRPVARTLDRDGNARPLVAWKHCRILQSGELFLLNPAHAASFDSRYFGPLDVSFVRGRAVALWTSETP
jgi:conjugative transfer signal peptidase TraF